MSKSQRSLAELAVSDTGFAFDPCSGATFTMNATGMAVLAALKEGLEPEAAAARIRAAFDVRGADVARDVADFVAALRQQGILGDDA
jgi:hypothetical protein